MTSLLAIALGGSAGALARFWVANGIYAFLGRSFPHGTLFVNVSGSLLMGLLTELMLQRFPLAAEYRAGVLIGFLGAYTTFSTFAIETLYLFEEGSILKAAVNLFLSVTLCLAAVWVGLVLGRRLFAGELYPWLGHGMAYGKCAGILLAGLGAGLMAELALRHAALSVPLLAVIVIVLLGGMAILSTMILVPSYPVGGAEMTGILSLFAASALGSTLSMGLGMLLARQL